MKKITLSLVAVAMATSYAGAASYSVNGNPTPVVDNIAAFVDGGPQIATFDSFDNSLGTLTGVQITITARQRADITLENDANAPVTASTTLSGNVTVTVDTNENGLADDALNTAATISLVTADQELEASDGVDAFGADFINYGTLVSGDSVNNVTTTNASLLDYFSNNGGSVTDLEALVGATGGWNALGVSDASLTISDFEAEGEVVVTYTYEAVPEPSSALLGLVGVGLIVLRRKRI